MRPCPACGEGEDVDLCEGHDFSNPRIKNYCVTCGNVDCNLCGPIRLTAEGAMEAWAKIEFDDMSYKEKHEALLFRCGQLEGALSTFADEVRYLSCGNDMRAGIKNNTMRQLADNARKLLKGD